MKKGFTLIEILIVVAIIAVLASMVLVGFGPAQRQGRDARRISDLRQVQNALELYYSKCGYYPGTTQASAPCGGFSSLGNSWSGLVTALTASNIGINSVPNDPSGGKSYSYGTNSDGSIYILESNLEDTNNPALQQSYKTNEFGVDCATSGHYCIKF
ncbi:MAG: type II secretion system protein [Patescibacteria group bacterium]